MENAFKSRPKSADSIQQQYLVIVGLNQKFL
jgi:hypothetical protein